MPKSTDLNIGGGIPSRPIHVVQRIPRYVPNKVVAHLMHMASIRGALTLDQIWAEFNLGNYSKDEMREFYQLLGSKVGAYKAVFNEVFEDLGQPEGERTTEEDIDRAVATVPRAPKKEVVAPAKAKKFKASFPSKKRSITPAVDEPDIASDPDRLAAASLRKKHTAELDNEE